MGGRDVLKLPKPCLPSDSANGWLQLEKKGVVVSGGDGPLHLGEQLSKVLGKLAVKNGHRLLSIKWPPKALPKGWGNIPAKEGGPSSASSASREGPSSSKRLCNDCGEALEFRKGRRDDGLCTFAVCSFCNEVKGGFRVKRT